MLRKLLTAALLLVATACASTPAENRVAEDPYENFNRNIFAFNEAVDMALLEPVARAYRFIVPEMGRDAIGNALRNFYEPVTMANALLQGDDQRFFTAMWRFLLNTTLGGAGIYDFAGENTDLNYRQEDFGQTIAVWSDDSKSSYLVLPIFGPSTVRDAFGRVVDIGLNPWTWVLEDDVSIGVAVANGIDQREGLLDTVDDIYDTSLDPYTTFRSGYLQRRRAQIKNDPHVAVEDDEEMNLY